MRNDLVVVRGGGRLGTAVAHRLRLSGFPVIVTEAARPTLIHRRAGFGSAIYESGIVVEEVPARRASNAEAVRETLESGFVPVLVDPAADIKSSLAPWVLVDCTGLDRNAGTRLSDAPIVVGVGLGFEAGRDVHAIVEARDCQRLGGITVEGTLPADPPASPCGGGNAGLVTSSGVGRFESRVTIGQLVVAGDGLGHVGGAPVLAPVDGIVTGLLMDGQFVGLGVRLAEVDARGDPALVSSIDPRARAVAGGVLEAILYMAAVGGGSGQALTPKSGSAGPAEGPTSS